MYALPNRIYKFKSSLIERLSGDVSDFVSILYVCAFISLAFIYPEMCGNN